MNDTDEGWMVFHRAAEHLRGNARVRELTDDYFRNMLRLYNTGYYDTTGSNCNSNLKARFKDKLRQLAAPFVDTPSDFPR